MNDPSAQSLHVIADKPLPRDDMRFKIHAFGYYSAAIDADPSKMPNRLLKLARVIVQHPPYFGTKLSSNRYFVGGWAYLALGRIDEAFELLEPVIRMKDKIRIPLSALQILVCAYLARGDTIKASLTLQRISDLYEEDVAVFHFLIDKTDEAGNRKPLDPAPTPN